MRTPRPITCTVVALMCACTLPTSWVAPVTGALAQAAWIPLAPVAWLGNAARMWLRPPASGPGGELQSLRDERDLFRGLYHQERARAEELSQRLSALDVTARLDRASGADVRYATARVIAVLPGGALRLSAGAREGVRAGDAVVVQGDALLGRVAGDVSQRQCVAVPLTDRTLGRIDAIVVPADADARGDLRGVPVQLVARGESLVGDVDLESGIREGDVVRLVDSGWSLGARGMRIGSVRTVRRKDEQPLRGMVEVVPAVDVARVAEAVIKASGEPSP